MALGYFAPVIREQIEVIGEWRGKVSLAAAIEEASQYEIDEPELLDDSPNQPHWRVQTPLRTGVDYLDQSTQDEQVAISVRVGRNVTFFTLDRDFHEERRQFGAQGERGAHRPLASRGRESQ